MTDVIVENLSELSNKRPDDLVTCEFVVPLVCPNCRKGELGHYDARIYCSHCDFQSQYVNGFLDLIIGQRFEDESDQTCLCYEESSNEYTAEYYWIPLFKQLQKVQQQLNKKSQALRILAVGCGIGLEVDMLCDTGFDAVGIDCGNRTQVWPNRKHQDRFLLANGMDLPFADESFDVVFCGCVFPHVGVVGDSFDVTEEYLQDRTNLAREMSRVLKTGGNVVVSSPNKNFPFDIFHGRGPGNYKPRFNKPGDRFLLSLQDYRKMFVDAGCKDASALHTTGYWGFVRSKNSLKGVLLSIPIRLVFKITSMIGFFRTSFLAPWLVVKVDK